MVGVWPPWRELVKLPMHGFAHGALWNSFVNACLMDADASVVRTNSCNRMLLLLCMAIFACGDCLHDGLDGFRRIWPGSSRTFLSIHPHSCNMFNKNVDGAVKCKCATMRTDESDDTDEEHYCRFSAFCCIKTDASMPYTKVL